MREWGSGGYGVTSLLICVFMCPLIITLHITLTPPLTHYYYMCCAEWRKRYFILKGSKIFYAKVSE